MTFEWCILWMIFLAVVAISFCKFGYSSGKEDGIKIGYAKGRKDVNKHLDIYQKNGGWSA